jgi:transcriptional regulator with XRE-family HTH domain
MNEVGPQIVSKRREMRITQKEFANLLDVTPTYLSQIETGKKRPSNSLLEKIGPMLDLSFRELHGIEESNSDTKVIISLLKEIIELIKAR